MLLACALWAPAAQAGKFNLGREATAEEVKGWDIDVRPDGQGLPEGKGTVAQGEALFQERCAACHGEFGEGVDRWPVLAGGRGTLASEDPEKTIGSYWPYLSTVYDYIYRAMPFGDAQSLTPDETYAIVAYLLNLNDLVGEDFELSRSNFTSIRLPNEKNFIDDPRPDVPKRAVQELCMKNCKPEVKITKRARILDVTPTDDKNPSASVD
ncbi:MAG: cytochrome c [Methyloligellaceae bacterium]